MRPTKIINYESIVGVLQETGCPICRFVKNYQSGLLQEPSEKEIQSLCSFHTWGLAAMQRAPSAARILEKLVEKQKEAPSQTPCDLCALLEIEEDRRIRELISLRDHRLVVQWLHESPTLCIPHGNKLKRDASQTFAIAIGSIMENCQMRLRNELQTLYQQYQGDTSKWGILGHAAEFLIAQRGLRR